MGDRVVDAHAAAHRVTHDVNSFHVERVDEPHHRIQRGDHRMAAEIITDAEAGELQNQAAEELGECAQHAAEIPPARHTRTGSVQQQQRRTVGRAGFVVAQNAGVSGDFAQGALVGEIVVIGRAPPISRDRTALLIVAAACHACVPPSMRISVPVMNAPSSETSIAMTPGHRRRRSHAGTAGFLRGRQDRHQPGEQVPVRVLRNVSAGGIGDSGLDASRRHADRPQSLARVLQRQRMGEGLDATFARRVGRHVRVRE